MRKEKKNDSFFKDIRKRRDNGLRRDDHEASDGDHAVFLHEASEFYPRCHPPAFEGGENLAISKDFKIFYSLF